MKTHFPSRQLADLPPFTCDRCAGTMDFDDLPERYLAFLEDEWGQRPGGR